MRGNDIRRDGLFSYVRPESRIPSSHPLRLIRGVADAALKALDAQLAALYAENGRPSIPPEHCCVRCWCKPSTRSVPSGSCWSSSLHLLFRWFVGLSVDAPVWVPTLFSRPRPAAGGRHRGSVYGRGAAPAAGQAVLSDGISLWTAR